MTAPRGATTIIPEYLEPLYETLICAYPHGIPPEEYRFVIVAVGSYSSRQSITEEIALVTHQTFDRVFADVNEVEQYIQQSIDFLA